MNDNLHDEVDYEYIEETYGVNIRPLEKSDVPEDSKPDAEKEKVEASPLKAAYDWASAFAFAVIIGVLFFIFIGRIIGVEGLSMFPTLYNGDRVFASNLFYEPEYGDIVIVKSEHYGSSPLVKRVIATAGQTIDIDFVSGIVYVDGEALSEDYVNTPTNDREDFRGPLTVPEGYIFVMGDNRNASTDSRSDRVGLIDTRNILGKVYLVLLPGEDEETEERDWSRIGAVS